MYIFYSSSGAIQDAVEADSSDVKMSWIPPNTTALYLDDTTWQDVWDHRDRYLIVSGVPVLQPYFTLATTTASGVATITATLNNPPSTLPTDAAMAFLSTAVPLTLSGTPPTASMEVAIDAMVSQQAIVVSATAAGCVGASANLGAGTDSSALQVFAPDATGNTSTTAYRVATTSKTVARAYYTGISSVQNQLDVLTEALQNLYAADGLVMHVFFSKVLPALTQSSYTAVSLTSDESNALADVQTNLLQYLTLTLANAYPSGGSRQHLYQSMLNTSPAYNQGASGYVAFLADTPNLR